MAKLTARQAEIVKFIYSYVKEKGTLPNKEEVRKHFGWASPNAPYSHFRLLFQKGALIKSNNNVGYKLPRKEVDLEAIKSILKNGGTK